MKLKSHHNAVFLVPLVLATMNLGCAFIPRHIALTYETVTTTTADGAKPVALAQFEDTREKKNVVGEVRNGWGIRTANVVIGEQDPGGWLANALASELERAGVRVEKVADTATADAPVVVTGSLDEFFIRHRFASFPCTIRVQVQVSSSGVPLLNKTYAVTEKGGNFWGGSVKEYERVSRAALQSLMRKIVPDVIESIR